jgi:3-deoxy-manno-octulosonate cytidylyltransferase (CMP-KDO synthetase)
LASTTPEFIAIVPARRGSTRLPDKPLIDVGGLPLVVRTAQQAQKSAASRVLVATDDDAILAACKAHGVEAMLTLSDHRSGTDRISEVTRLIGLAGDALVVNVQGDEPLIDPTLIDAVAAALAAAPDCAMATACHALADPADLINPNIVKVVRDAKGRALYFSRAPIPFERDRRPAGVAAWSLALRHIGIYAYRAEFLLRFPTLAEAPLESIEMLEQLRALWHGERIVVIDSASSPAPGVDTEDDLARIRALVAGSAKN